jgi:hypothetical protein
MLHALESGQRGRLRLSRGDCGIPPKINRQAGHSDVRHFRWRKSRASQSEHENCFSKRMQLNPAPLRRPTSTVLAPRPRAAASTSSSRYGSPQASAEIHAYIAARDIALADAERNVTRTTLNRAFLANELVQNFLKPARSAYSSQSLPEGEAATERKRCDAAQRRIAQLRACSAVAA